MWDRLTQDLLVSEGHKAVYVHIYEVIIISQAEIIEELAE